jgi:Rrf2 family protein
LTTGLTRPIIELVIAEGDTVAYSTEFSRAISISLLIHQKMDEHGFEFVSTKTIAELLKIPAPTVVRILRSLNVAGLTTTKEGAKGGVLLSKSITDVTLLDIFLAVEHSPLFKIEIDFAVDDSRIDSLRSSITIHLQDAEKAMRGSLEKTTLLDIYESL